MVNPSALIVHDLRRGPNIPRAIRVMSTPKKATHSTTQAQVAKMSELQCMIAVARTPRVGSGLFAIIR